MKKIIINLLFFLFVLIGTVNAIADCTTINSPGVYNLTGNISTNGAGAPGGANALQCIELNTTGIVLDCQGFSIINTDDTPVSGVTGVYSNSSDIEIKNCNFYNFNDSAGASIYYLPTVANAHNVTIRDGIFVNSRTFIALYPAINAENITVSNLTLSSINAVDLGIDAADVRNAILSNIRIAFNASADIWGIAGGSVTNFSIKDSFINISQGTGNARGVMSEVGSNITLQNVTIEIPKHAVYVDSANLTSLDSSFSSLSNITTANNGNITLTNTTFSLNNVTKPTGSSQVYVQKQVNITAYNLRGLVPQFLTDVFVYRTLPFDIQFNGLIDSNGAIFGNYTALVYNSTNTPFNFSNMTVIAYYDFPSLFNTTDMNITAPNSSGYFNYVVRSKGRDEINECNRNLTSSGVYYVVSNLTKDSTGQRECINVRANNVVLDCLGYWIYPNVTLPNNLVGVNVSYNNVTVQNCNFANFNRTTSTEVKAFNYIFNVSNFTLYNTSSYNSYTSVNLTNVNFSNVSIFSIRSNVVDAFVFIVDNLFNSTISSGVFSIDSGFGFSLSAESGFNNTFSHLNYTTTGLNGGTVFYGWYTNNDTFVNITANTAVDFDSLFWAQGDGFEWVYNSSLIATGSNSEALRVSKNISVFNTLLNATRSAVYINSANANVTLNNVTVQNGNLTIDSNSINLSVFNSSVRLSNVSAVTHAASSIYFVVPVRVNVTASNVVLSGATVYWNNYSIQSGTSDVSGFVDFNVTVLVYNNSQVAGFNFTSVTFNATKTGYNSTTTSVILTPNASQTNVINLVLLADAAPAAPSGGGGGGGGGSGGAASSAATNVTKVNASSQTQVNSTNTPIRPSISKNNSRSSQVENVQNETTTNGQNPRDLQKTNELPLIPIAVILVLAVVVFFVFNFFKKPPRGGASKEILIPFKSR